MSVFSSFLKLLSAAVTVSSSGSQGVQETGLRAWREVCAPLWPGGICWWHISLPVFCVPTPANRRWSWRMLCAQASRSFPEAVWTHRAA